MATAFNFATLVEPVSAAEPCGPDLDLAGDIDYQQVVARTEGQLPGQFLERTESGSVEVKKVEIDFAACYKSLVEFIEQSRDLRLLAIYARLLALQRDLDGFAACLGGIAALLSERWDEVHPQAEDGDYGFRIAALQALDDMVTVVLPLQHTPLVSHPRLRGISYRTFLLARKEAEPREGEAATDEGSLGRALGEVDLDALRSTRETLVSLNESTALIQTVSAERTGGDQPVTFDRLPALLASMLAAIDPIVVARDPSASPAAPPAGTEADVPAATGVASAAAPRPPTAALASLDAAAASLAAVVGFLEQTEPSSPVVPLVRQAQQLVGKSFLDVVRILMPDQAEDTKVAIGPDRAIVLTFQQLATASGTGKPANTDEGQEESESGETADGDGPVPSDKDGGEKVAPPREETAPAPAIEIRTRLEAIALLKQVAAFFRATEPSNPIPLLIDRACGFADRDFLAILKELLPSLSEPV